ncbi:conjugal transfer protein [Salmonella enterica]|nr:conjugal transfer protein [Salmonella enterica]EAX6603679.1 conjugal transfer protein [Salmonella enterica]
MVLAFSVHATPSSEQENLALAIKQLNQLESTLQRAQAQSALSDAGRFYFDYPQIYSDISAIREGVAHYLSPSRAQPRGVSTFSGLYRREATYDQ